MRKIERELKKQYAGVVIKTTRRGHYRMKLPNGAVIFASATPSDWRSSHNLRQEVRRTLKQAPRHD